jgi:hypothetical protein
VDLRYFKDNERNITPVSGGYTPKNRGIEIKAF